VLVVSVDVSAPPANNAKSAALLISTP